MVSPPGQPLISVVMPTYNRPESFAVALGSVLGQTYSNIEVIVADDGTDERTREHVESLDDPRIRYLRNPSDIDALENSRRGFDAATGAYVAGCHDDDFWHEEFLEQLVPPLEADPELVMSFCDLWRVDDQGQVDSVMSDAESATAGRATLRPGKHRPHRQIAMANTASMQLGVVVRNGVADWNTFPRECAAVFDRWFAYVVCRDGGGAYYVPRRLAYSREHLSNATSLMPLAWSEAGAYCYKLFAEDPAMEPVRPLLRRQAAEYRTISGIVRLKQGQPREARRAAVSALRTRPAPRAVGLLMASVLPGAVRARLLPG